MFYDRFSKLCEQAGVTPAKVAENIGVNKSTMYMWKNQGTTPKYDTTKKLADYFGVSVDSLLGDLTEYKPDMGIPAFSSGAVQLAKDYDSLDQWGRKQVRVTADAELERVRCQAGTPRQEAGKATPAVPEGKDAPRPLPSPESPKNGG